MTKDFNDLKPYITVTSGMSGFFAVQVWWNDESDVGFWEPYQTGIGRYASFEDAEAEAKDWATDARLNYHSPNETNR